MFCNLRVRFKVMASYGVAVGRHLQNPDIIKGVLLWVEIRILPGQRKLFRAAFMPGLPGVQINLRFGDIGAFTHKFFPVLCRFRQASP